jgi:hypothetical protein
MTTYDFGQALGVLRGGGRVTRQGWNGKGMWIVLQPGYPDGVEANAQSARAYGVTPGARIVIRPYLAMRTVSEEYVPWVASQTDLLASDWYTAGQA